jgi:beta-lactam-binding protein with PASTA domain
MPIRRAARELEAIGLFPGEVHKQTSAAQEPGTVMDQDPPPGSKVPVESPVLLVIAVPPEIVWVSIPDVDGLTPQKAEFLLAREQLALGRITKRKSERKENTIIQQDPGVGHQVRIGTAVNVVVAAQTRVEVPDLIDLQQEQIEVLLARARLRLGDIQEQESSKQAGIVLAQRPEAHAQVAVGTTVDIEIAAQKAPGIVDVVVPDAIGLRIPNARQQFLDARLVPGELSQIPSDLEPGTVLRQQPLPGARVPPGTAVKLWIATEKTLDPRWLGIPLVLLLGLGGTYLMRYRIRSQGNAETLIDGLVITPHVDPGSVHLQTDHPKDLALEIRLRPVSDTGSQRLVPEGDLIEKESREP